MTWHQINYLLLACLQSHPRIEVVSYTSKSPVSSWVTLLIVLVVISAARVTKSSKKFCPSLCFCRRRQEAVTEYIHPAAVRGQAVEDSRLSATLRQDSDFTQSPIRANLFRKNWWSEKLLHCHDVNEDYHKILLLAVLTLRLPKQEPACHRPPHTVGLVLSCAVEVCRGKKFHRTVKEPAAVYQWRWRVPTVTSGLGWDECPPDFWTIKQMQCRGFLPSPRHPLNGRLRGEGQLHPMSLRVGRRGSADQMSRPHTDSPPLWW